jgi:soluble lytic murein transglycosylase-like protein
VRRLVVRAARRHHVAPSLVLAIAWQESGWQQKRLSSAGAVGVMQVLPATGRWMSLYVGRHLNVYGLGDNVQAGVVLVRLLRGETTLRRAVGAYYQGLGSVRRHGLYPSTRHYVRNVLALDRRLRHGWRPA